MIRVFLGVVVLWSIAPTIAIANAQEQIIRFEQVDSRLRDYGYVDRDNLWNEDVIFVCWENAEAANEQQRSWVARAIQESWERESRLQFTGWSGCQSES